MRTQSTWSLHFQRRICEFCSIRIAPVASRRALENIRPYLTSLITCRKTPPMRNGRIDWQAVAQACSIEDEMTTELKKNLRSGLEAIIRWLDKERPEEDDRPTVEVPSKKTKPAAGSAKTMAARRSFSAAASTIEREQARTKPGVQPRPIEEFPKPLFDWTEESEGFQQALIYHMRRHGDRYWHLHRAIMREEDAFDHKTLLSWTIGTKVPRPLASVERRYRLPDAYFKAKLPHQARSVSGHEVGSDIGAAERRRLAWHLPDNFNSLPFAKREEILEWVRRVIISGSTDYRHFQLWRRDSATPSASRRFPTAGLLHRERRLMP